MMSSQQVNFYGITSFLGVEKDPTCSVKVKYSTWSLGAYTSSSVGFKYKSPSNFLLYVEFGSLWVHKHHHRSVQSINCPPIFFLASSLGLRLLICVLTLKESVEFTS